MPISGSLKGHVFDATAEMTLPHDMQDARRRASRLQALTQEQKAKQAAALTERYRIVSKCNVKGCGESLIAEEVVPHRLNHESGIVRSMVATVLQQTRDNQQRVLEVLKELLGAT